jgi:hypothetical protein
LSPIYRYILSTDSNAIPFGTPGASYFEPLMAHFQALMDACQFKEGDHDDLPE